MRVTTLVVTPAYGRDYRTEAEALAGWAGGHDFRNETIGVPGTYVGCGETDLMIQMGVQRVQIRFNKKQDVTVVELVQCTMPLTHYEAAFQKPGLER